MSLFLCLLMASLTHPAAAAEAGQPQQESPALKQLQDAAKSGMAPVADGSKLNGDGTETVSVQKNILLNVEHYPASRSCHSDGDIGGDGRGHGASRTCEDIPEHTVKRYGDRDSLRIVDRGQYERHQGAKWAGWGGLIGGLIGALGFLALLAVPGGAIALGAAIGIGIATTAVGAGIGAVIGNRVAVNDAKHKPENYTEDEVKREETSFP